MSILERLIGQEVRSFGVDKGTLVLELSGAVISAYNPARGAPPAEYIGTTISFVRVIDQERFSLAFSSGVTLDISLKDEDYSGPEAFSVRFSDGTIVVE